MILYVLRFNLLITLLFRYSVSIKYSCNLTWGRRVNSFASLSKCYNLSELDLSLVYPSLPFVRLKKAIRKLDKLEFLSLPKSTTIIVERSACVQWPPRLRHIRFSGRFPINSMEFFSWPEQLSSLTLIGCIDLSVNAISTLICSRHLGRQLRHLGISYDNKFLQPESINAVPRFLPNLRSLSVPGDLLQDDFFNNNGTPLSLEYLAIERATTNMSPSLGFSERSLISALDYGLSNLRSVFFDPVYSTPNYSVIFGSINDALKAQWKRRSPEEFASRESKIGTFFTTQSRFMRNE